MSSYDIMPDAIKELYLIDGIRKDVRISFPNGERADIVSADIVEESFRFSESICSQRSLKFGLCESSMVQFECVGIEDIEGCEIEVFLEIDISSLSADIVKEYGNTSSDVAYPYFSLQYGRFKVKSSKRQSDMNRRTVIAYSDTINSNLVISPFEKAKWETQFLVNHNYTYNPAHFAICSISQNVNLSLDSKDFQVFDGIGTLKGELTQTNYSPALYNSYNPSSGRDIGVYMSVDVMKWDLLKYINYGLMLAYKMGDSVTTATAVASAFREFTEPYRDRITSYESKLEEVVQTIMNHCHPFGYMQNYSKKHGGYMMHYAYGMKDSGFLAPEFPGYNGGHYGIYLPYRVNFEIRKITGSVINAIETYSYELFDSDEIDVNKVQNSSATHDRIFIPVISGTVTRSRTKTGEYVLDTTQYPDTMKAFRALLELNACFLKQGVNGVYSFYFLDGKYGIYPSDDLYPNNELYPSMVGYDIETSDYIQAWHSDERVKPYTAVMANYKDSDGNERMAEYHEAEYWEEYVEVFTDTYTKAETTYSLAEVIFDFPTENPFENGMTVYVKCEGLIIDSVSVKSGGDVLFDIPVGSNSTMVQYTADNWEDATRIAVSIDISGATVGASYNIAAGEVIREEVLGKQYNTLDLSGNYLIQNYAFSESELLELLENLLVMIGGVTYMPTDIKLIGKPWIKAGDYICVYTNDEIIETIVLRRTLKGIQSLIDTFESR